MIRKLFLFSGAAFLLSLACIAGAVAFVSQEVGTTGWIREVVHDGNHVRFRKGTAAKPDPSATKSLTWTGGELLAIDLPADVVYVQGATPSVSVTGPQSVVDRVRLESGRLSLADGPDYREHVRFAWTDDGFDVETSSDGLRITVTAPNVKRFELAGSGDLDLRGYDQPALDINIAGSGSVHGVGRTDTLTLDVSGSGSADLAALKAKDATATISGSGAADIFSSGNAKIDISGSGNVDLATKPTKLESHISGSGSIDQDGMDE